MKQKMPTEASTFVSKHHKDSVLNSNKHDNETQLLFDYLQNNTCTATMATAATGIVQKSICRYKRTLEKMGLLYVIEVRPCSITGLPAQWLTTNPDIIPKSDSQLSLFWKGCNNE